MPVRLASRSMINVLASFMRNFTIVVVLYMVAVTSSAAQEGRLIVNHDVGLRSCPALECPIVLQLPILSKVYVHTRDGGKRASTGDEEGYWAHVSTGRHSSRNSRQDSVEEVGWVLDAHIGDPHTFKPVRRWITEEFGYCIGDYCPELKFAESGYYTRRFSACFDGLCPDPPSKGDCHSEDESKEIRDGLVYCISEGRLYRSGDVIRLGGPNSNEFLYFNKRKELCADMFTCRAYPK